MLKSIIGKRTARFGTGMVIGVLMRVGVLCMLTGTGCFIAAGGGGGFLDDKLLVIVLSTTSFALFSTTWSVNEEPEFLVLKLNLIEKILNYFKIFFFEKIF